MNTNKMLEKSNRDLYLDFYRGMGVLAILLHHTVFWTGMMLTTPDLIKNISRLFEVPLFIFLAGWSAKYNHNLDKVFSNLIKIWLKWILFISLTDLVYFIVTKNVTITSSSQWVYQCYFSTDSSFLPMLPVLPASMWFMPMFIALEIIGSCILMIKDILNIDDKKLIYIILFLMIGLSYLTLINSDSWFLLSRNMCFYGTMYLVGYLSYKLINKRQVFYISVFVLDIICWYISGRLFGIPVTDLTNAKFPPHIMYVFASMICVIICIALHSKIDYIVKKSRLIRFIGRNALSYYFSQGIACSIPYIYVLNNAQIVEKYSWKIILLVALIFNISIGVLIGSLFSYLLIFIEALIKKLGGN